VLGKSLNKISVFARILAPESLDVHATSSKKLVQRTTSKDGHSGVVITRGAVNSPMRKTFCLGKG
jgi:hypothetical protein